MRDTFRKIVVDTYDGIDIESTPIKTPGPFFELFFKRKEIQEFIENTSQPQDIRNEVRLLHDFMQKDKTTVSNVKEYETLIGQGKVGIDTLWTLFPPNELVIRNDGQAPECWLCRNVSFDSKLSCWWIYGVRLDFDGHKIGMTKLRYPISIRGTVDGRMEISQLPLIPFRYFPDRSETRKKILKRGKIFQEIMSKDLEGHAYRHYKGPLWEKYDLDTPPKIEVSLF